MPDLPQDVDVLVVGAGQAGLGTAYWLTRHPHLRVLVVDRAPVGQSWVDRWDSLVLFTPRRFSGLPGLPFPAGPTRCPTRLEMAAHLRAYAARFDLPVRTGVDVCRIARRDGAFVAGTSHGTVRARHVVLALGTALAAPGSLPRRPAWRRGCTSCTPATTVRRTTSHRATSPSWLAGTPRRSSRWSSRRRTG